MRLRSLLFVPGDSERKFARAQQSGADGLILDLENAVAPSQKATLRDRVAEARKIVATFDANPGAGTLGIDGKMYDIPHLKAARKTLASI